ncbi:hypothetical protein M6B38_213000 [Iris pallida]|uniref:Uncharacterized protein n=1 Tax=Iris pallida TaxID=29817 RepID=A0AAX6E1Z5_IRIPA|nr:hypothetical protein M6B38_213000 [Iris pallida]
MVVRWSPIWIQQMRWTKSLVVWRDHGKATTNGRRSGSGRLGEDERWWCSSVVSTR